MVALAELVDHAVETTRGRSIQTAEEFFADLFGEALSADRRLAIFTVPGLRTHLFAGPAEAAAYACQQATSENVYFGLGLVTGSPAGRGKAEDIAAIGGLWADIDLAGPAHPKGKLPASIEQARTIIARLPLARSILIDSGHGLHPYWLFREPWVFDTPAERDIASRTAKGWHGLVCVTAEALGWHLENLGDLTRVLRVPGTVNHKLPGEPAEVRIIERRPELRYNPDDFEPFIVEPNVAVVATTGALVLRPDAQPPADKLVAASAASPKFARTWLRQRPDLPDQSASGYDLALATIAAMMGWSDPEIADLIIAARRQHGDKPEKALRPDYMARTIARARQAAAEMPAESSDVDISGIAGQAEPGTSDQPVGQTDCPDPLPLDSPKPPPMQSGLIDGWLGSMIERIAESTETPRELAALLCLSAVATACQGRFSVRPEPGYFEPVNIWTAPAMMSGQRKTGVHKLATAPLVDWEREQCRQAAGHRQAVESQIKTLAARVARLRARCAAEEDPSERERLGQEIEQIEATMPQLPVLPRLFTQDVTPEHLGTLMAEQSERMAILSDEGGIFDILAGRYSSGIPNLDLFLQAHSGAPVRVDRGSRPSVLLNHPLLTMGLSPQPDVLRALNTKPGFRGRGLLARFLYALPESKMGYRDLEPRHVPDHVAERYAEGLRALIEMVPRFDEARKELLPHVLALDGDAYGLWKAHQRRVEIDLRQDGRFGGMTDWAGKLPGAVARLAALLHCARHALSGAGPIDRQIDRDTMQQAVLLGELLAEHALVVFDLMNDDSVLESARKAWRHITSNGMSAFTFRDLWHPLRGTFKRTEEFEPVVETLQDHCLILPVDERAPGRRGRPGRRFRVNPKTLGVSNG